MNRDPTKPDLSPVERILMGYLWRHHRGAAFAVPYHKLRELLLPMGWRIGEREIYDIVSEIVRKGRPVGTTANGAFITMDSKDARLATRYLAGRVVRQQRRIRVFKRTMREGLTKQQYLDLADAESAYDEARQKAGTLFA